MSSIVEPARAITPVLDAEQVARFREHGYLLLPHYFSDYQIDRLRVAVADELAAGGPSLVYEQDGQTVRSVYGSHQRNAVFARLVKLPQLVGACEQVLNASVYTYQFKLNIKVALTGNSWPWHQDYVFWQREDGLPQPDIVSVVVFLDAVTELNGPMMLLPGSHKLGVLPGPVKTARPVGYEKDPSWISNTTAELRYTVDLSLLRDLIRDRGVVAPKGPPGTMLMFHGNLVHGSGPNFAAFDRRLAIISYSRIDNIPDKTGARPEFLCASNFQPIAACEDLELSPTRVTIPH